MKSKYFLVALILFASVNVYAVNQAYLKTKIKNRAQMQQATGAFKYSKYNYVSQRDIKAARYNNNVNLGVVNVKRGEQVRDVNVYVDSNSRIDIYNKRESKVQVGVVNVEKNARLQSANVVVRARNGINIRQQAGNTKRVSQIGVVNMRKSSAVKNISTRIDTNKKIKISNY
ncbi:hypothetical protein JHD48_00845 [Sulfurimonas sp. SAG-AH-194-I05]|nr:hypothetical protein [Sulfurimonas sp. SAG-AH-194-I05]MDF1874275.1 hypothetical protein [Sulfurimonas sp. SAG-AH-194-I05]